MISKKKLVFILIPVFFIFGCQAYWEFKHPQYHVSLGDYSSQEAGESASIKQVSKEAKVRSWKESFHISWNCTGENCGSMKYRLTIYDRKYHLIGYEVDVGSGFAHSWSCLNDEKLHEIASHSNPVFKDFE